MLYRRPIRYFTTILLIGLVKSLFAQHDTHNFEFGQDLEEYFYFAFIKDNSPILDLTKSKYFQKRKELNITSIKATFYGFSLDSLYLKNKDIYLKEVAKRYYFHDGYSTIEIYTFDEEGYTTSRIQYPISSHLNSNDSIREKKFGLKSNKINDSLIANSYYDDSIVSKTVYFKGVKYELETVRSTVSQEDSHTKQDTLKTSKYNLVPTFYHFNTDGKIENISSTINSDLNFHLNYEYPDKYKVIIHNTRKGYWRKNEEELLENHIFKNRSGSITKSVFYQKDQPNDCSTLIYKYDRHKNLYKVIKKVKLEYDKDYKDIVLNVKHIYKQNKLVMSVEKTKLNGSKINITYYYKDGLLVEKRFGNFKVCYEYNLN